MSWQPQSFDEACRRAAGRRAYNRKRRLERARRISTILVLQDRGVFTGRALAASLGVHEATVSRDLKFIRKLKADFRRHNYGFEMRARSFRWIQGGRGWETTFEIRDGVRVR
jgi:predicted DNA-binding transcriptional regulator YafY